MWGHPQVLGFVDVSNLVEPVITRDEFKRSTSRVAVYKALCGLEKELRAALEKVSVEQRDKSMASLETVLRGVLARVANHDKKKQKKKETQVLEELAAAAPAPPPPDSITTDDIEYKVLAADRLQLEKALLTTEQDELTDKDAIALSASKAPRTGSTLSAPYDIRFVHAHADLEGRQRRSFVAGDCIFVNIDHPNFTDRVSAAVRGRIAKFCVRARVGGSVCAIYKKKEKEGRTSDVEIFGRNVGCNWCTQQP